MPLPNPLYLTQQDFNWSNTQVPAALMTATFNATIAGSNRSIRWDGLDSFDRKTVHDLIMGYATRSGNAEAAALTNFLSSSAYQVINFGGTLVGGNNAGLKTGTTYTASFVLDTGTGPTTQPISIVGAAADTVTDVIAKIVADMTDAVMVINADGNIDVASVANGAGKVVEMFDGNLFHSMTGFQSIEERRVGVTTVENVFDLNFKNNHQPYAELLIGSLRVITNKAPRTSRSSNDIYFNHGNKLWLYVATDTTTAAP